MTRTRHVASPSTFGDMRGLPTPSITVVILIITSLIHIRGRVGPITI